MIDEKTLFEYRKEIIETGKKLHDSGLLVRTWGNVSRRIDEDHFLITPSGIRYEDIKPEMIIPVRISDLFYEGDIKPSSEKAVHAACYRQRPENNFIIHTHQVFASAVGSLGISEISVRSSKYYIPVAKYALPGGDELAKNVENTLEKNPDCSSIIMSNHGTICISDTSDEAFDEAMQMEDFCRNYLLSRCGLTALELSGEKTEFIAVRDAEKDFRIENGSLNDLVKEKLLKEIFSQRQDISYIVSNNSEAVQRLIESGASEMRPLLDDFAQLIGTKIQISVAGKAPAIDDFVNAYFDPANGSALCFGTNLDDAEAVEAVLEKGAVTMLAALGTGKGSFLSEKDCIIMNENYRKNYSKLAEE